MNCLSSKRKFKNKKPVWTDPDDETAHDDTISEVEDCKAVGQSDDSTDEEDSDDCDIYVNDVRSKKINLESNELIFKHQVHINSQRSYAGKVNQVQFHPKSRIALVTVSRGQADLFEIDGERNRYIQNIQLPRTLTPYCGFVNDGDSIMITSERYAGDFYIFDVMSNKINTHKLNIGRNPKVITDFTAKGKHIACRKEGNSEVLILNNKSYEIESTIKLNEAAKVIRFTNDWDLITAGENASTYVWDLRKTSICKNKFIDEGTIHITSLDLSVRSRQLAIGSDSGMVNIYELKQCLEKRFPKPLKTLSNLKSDIDILKYNPTGELLLMGASAEQKGFRLINSHSGKVYRNFPVQGKRYDHLMSADYSPLGGYLALGCSTGRAQLVRLPYYKSY